DDGDSRTPGQNPFSLLDLRQRTQILTLSELHILSPTIVNEFTAGFSRSHYSVLLPVSVQPSGVQSFVSGLPIGQFKIGGVATAAVASDAPRAALLALLAGGMVRPRLDEAATEPDPEPGLAA